MALTCLRWLWALLLVTVMIPSAVADNSINVGGSVDYALGHDGIVSLTGDRGFSLDGFALLPESRLDAKLQCLPSCFPGTIISLVAIAGGNDLRGQATLDGILYPFPSVGSVGCDFVDCASAGVIFDGQVVAPPFGQSSTVVLTAPVEFTGSFFHIDNGVQSDETLAGIATATLTLREDSFFGSSHWEFDHITYDLVPSPVPTALLLLATGLAAVGVIRRRSR